MAVDDTEIVVFFFQAEDGIRDYKVTGVQTCALPISKQHGFVAGGADASGKAERWSNASESASLVVLEREDLEVTLIEARGGDAAGLQIGRASCRERG